MHILPLWLLASLVLALAGCAGDGPTSGGQGTDLFSRVQVEIFNQHCLDGPCHNPTSQAGSLVLTEGFSYDNLVVDSEPDNAAARAAGLERVVPFDTGRSFLLIKLTGPGAGQGDRMPQGRAPLSPDEINIVTQWILAGAPAAQTQTVTAGTTATATPTDTPPLPTATPVATTPGEPSPTVPAAATLTPATSSPSPTASTMATPTTALPSPTPTTPEVVSLAEVQAQVFTPHCLTAGCHSGAFPAGNMSLEAGAAYAALVNVAPMNAAALNAGLVRVRPNEPENSFLLIKLTGPTVEQGSPMPMGAAPLSSELIELVRTWIAQGANQ